MSGADKTQSGSRRLSGRRAIKRTLPVSASRQLAVSIRYFRTRPDTRTKKQHQLVLQLYGLSVREIAITWSRRKGSAASNLVSLRHKFALPLVSITLGTVGAGYFSANLHETVRLDIPDTNTVALVSVAQPAAKVMPASQPTHLSIPSINVDSDLASMGLGPGDEIQMPLSSDIAAWYTGSPTPGELGPAVIAGHVDSPDDIGVFWRLRDLRPGDKVFVARADGSTATFAITAIEEYPKASFPTDKVYGPINYSGLRLITCGGAFNNDTREYTDNIVAYGILQ
ncbi:MAG TPA: class F sortase [Candidatus Saccharimonadales bacterium]|nr:class F sortase [Candidatus Saccharimonadales bacterium]